MHQGRGRTGNSWEQPRPGRLARDGDPEPIDFEETDTNLAIGWKGNYRIEGRAFAYADRESGVSLRSLAIPLPQLLNWAK
jgi:hypothetical protein